MRWLYLKGTCRRFVQCFLQFSLFTQGLSEFTVFPVSSQSFCPEVSAYLNNERELMNRSLALLKAQLYPALAFYLP